MYILYSYVYISIYPLVHSHPLYTLAFPLVRDTDTALLFISRTRRRFIKNFTQMYIHICIVLCIYAYMCIDMYIYVYMNLTELIRNFLERVGFKVKFNFYTAIRKTTSAD